VLVDHFDVGEVVVEEQIPRRLSARGDIERLGRGVDLCGHDAPRLADPA
jgi:hypothetical protein